MLEKSENVVESAATAIARIADNPFSVSEEDLREVRVDVVFRLNRMPRGLRASVAVKSKARRLLRSVNGACYLRKEKCFYFPVEALNDFLRKLRDRKLSFAVEKQAARVLKESAELRARAIEQGELLSAEELRRACLVPIIDKDSQSPHYKFESFTTEQLRETFPSISQYQDKLEKAKRIGELEILDLLAQLRHRKSRFWLTREAQEGVDKQQAQMLENVKAGRSVRESVLFSSSEAEHDIALMWVRTPDARLGLIIDATLEKELLKLAKEFSWKHFSKDRREKLEQGLFYPVPRSQVLRYRQAISEKLGGEQAKEACGFIEELEELETRATLFEAQRRYCEMQDAEPPGLDAGIKNTLFPHQRVAVKWLLETPQGILGDDMGLGKTLSVLAAFHTLRAQGLVEQLLVVCPNSLTRNWVREGEQWFEDIKLVQVPEGKSKRHKFLGKLQQYEPDWLSGVVVNYESFRLADMLPAFDELCRTRKIFLVLDESQRAKNPKSKTFQALSMIAPLCERRVLLSGTPTPKDITDIWSQVLLVDKGERFGTNYYKWLESVAELGTKWSKFAIKKFRPDEVEDASKRVREVLLRRKKEEVVDLPEKIFSIRDVKMGGSQKKFYEEVRRDLLLRVRSSSGELFLREIDNILEEFLRAVQVASNPRLVDPEWEGEPAKFVELDEIVREIVEEKRGKLVIWTNYRINVAELVERYQTHGAKAFTGNTSTAERSEIVDDFQSGAENSTRILVAIPAAGGVGITLTAAQNAVYLDKTWNAEHWMQSVDRVHRIGQTGTVSIMSLHATKVDEIIYYNLKRKERSQAALLGDTKEEEVSLAKRGENREVDSSPSREELIGALEEVVALEL